MYVKLLIWLFFLYKGYMYHVTARRGNKVADIHTIFSFLMQLTRINFGIGGNCWRIMDCFPPTVMYHVRLKIWYALLFSFSYVGYLIYIILYTLLVNCWRNIDFFYHQLCVSWYSRLKNKIINNFHYFLINFGVGVSYGRIIDFFSSKGYVHHKL